MSLFNSNQNIAVHKKSLDVFVKFKAQGIRVPDNIQEKIYSKLKDFEYKPKIAVIGKCGVGKSTLCHALQGNSDKNNITQSSISATSTDIEELVLKISPDKTFTLGDFPGFGMSSTHNDEVIKKYEDKLLDYDLILFVLKADDKDLLSDKKIFSKIIVPLLEKSLPVVFVINQVEKLGNLLDWDFETHEPKTSNKKNLITEKSDFIKKYFQTRNYEIPVLTTSAIEKYELIDILFAIVRKLSPTENTLFKEYATQTRIERQAFERAKEELKQDVIDFGKKLWKKSDITALTIAKTLFNSIVTSKDKD